MMSLGAFLKMKIHPSILKSLIVVQTATKRHKSHFTLSESFMSSCGYPGGSWRWNPAACIGSAPRVLSQSVMCRTQSHTTLNVVGQQHSTEILFTLSEASCPVEEPYSFHHVHELPKASVDWSHDWMLNWGTSLLPCDAFIRIIGHNNVKLLYIHPSIHPFSNTYPVRGIIHIMLCWI